MILREANVTKTPIKYREVCFMKGARQKKIISSLHPKRYKNLGSSISFLPLDEQTQKEKASQKSRHGDPKLPIRNSNTFLHRK